MEGLPFLVTDVFLKWSVPEVTLIHFVPSLHKLNITSLNLASEKGHLAIVQTLVKAGANVNIAKSDVSHVMFNSFNNCAHTSCICVHKPLNTKLYQMASKIILSIQYMVSLRYMYICSCMHLCM